MMNPTHLTAVAERCFNITQSYLSIDTGSLMNSKIIEETQAAINITRELLIGNIFQRWDPFTGQISFSYNGGKDCQVLLIIYLSCLWEFFMAGIKDSQYHPKYHGLPIERLPTVYIDQKDTFRTLQDFLEGNINHYSLSLYESRKDCDIPMADAFSIFLDSHPETKAIVIGVRHTDPFGEALQAIQPTDSSWPQFIRLQPLLHWTLANIWSFLLYSGEEMCGLYSLGFTSLGSVSATVANPYLEWNDEDSQRLQNKFKWEIANNYHKDGKLHISHINEEDLSILTSHDGTLTKFYPGWYLINDSYERAGRFPKKA